LPPTLTLNGKAIRSLKNADRSWFYPIQIVEIRGMSRKIMKEGCNFSQSRSIFLVAAIF
jgi:hypothetical protein